ncbi:MAG: hypothetical protein Q9227_009292 [Pyrenula ochraceoflavens]
MEAAITIDELVARAKQHQSQYQPMPLIEELQASGQGKKPVMIITCMDPRIFPDHLFGLKFGEALVVRNIAGHPRPQLNDILAIDIGLGVAEIMIIHHTDCGSTHFTNAGVRDKLKELHPDSPAVANLDSMDFGAVHQKPVEQSVVDDMNFIRKEAPFVRDGLREKVRGFMLDIKTGELREVKA